jgi:glyoxylase-like metal-dependent hydrolase (beta-lactamase superfamily II)
MPYTYRILLPGVPASSARGALGWCSVVLVEGPDFKLLFDTGSYGDRHRLLDAFKDAGVSPSDIEAVFLSHFHFDHVMSADLFPRSRFYLSHREWQYARGEEHPGNGDHFVPALMIPWIEKRLVLFDSDQEIRPGLRSVALPGHTPGLSGLLLEAQSVLLTGDGIKNAWDFVNRLPPPSYFSARAALESYRRAAAAARVIVPGHDRPFAVEKENAIRYLERYCVELSCRPDPTGGARTIRIISEPQRPPMDSTMLPPVALIRQVTPAPELEDITATLHKGFAGLDLARRVKPGQKVALTGGSRGITDMAKVIRHTAGFLRSLGAEPYVAPAMGSHGGASGSGQSRLLARLGITEETVGAPIVSHMETRELGRTSFGMPVLIGEDFIRADWIIVVNRVKPHTSFRGSVESGLLKMLAVGMGKRDGAERSHAHFLRHGFETVVRETSAMVMDKLPLLCGIALVENRLEKTAELEVLAPEQFAEREPRLLARARDLMGKVPFEQADLLIVDEMGKNLSGSGMDSSVTGRIYNQAVSEPSFQKFRRIYVRDLTAPSEGNALGVGTADFCARRLVDKIDAEKTRINCVTAAVPEKGRVPIVCDSDLAGVAYGLQSAGVSSPLQARIIWIKNTLDLEFMKISPALEAEARGIAGVEFLLPFKPMPFDPMGQLPFDWFPKP